MPWDIEVERLIRESDLSPGEARDLVAWEWLKQGDVRPLLAWSGYQPSWLVWRTLVRMLDPAGDSDIRFEVKRRRGRGRLPNPENIIRDRLIAVRVAAYRKLGMTYDAAIAQVHADIRATGGSVSRRIIRDAVDRYAKE